MANNNNETFIGFAGYLFAASIICFPFLGFGGMFSAAVAIYFCLVFTNGVSSAENRNNKRK